MIRGVLLTFETVVMYGHFDESRGLPGVAKSSRSPLNFQFLPRGSKMALCQPKPLHNIYYVSIDQCVPGGVLMDGGLLGT